jgi:hypothetical protein
MARDYVAWVNAGSDADRPTLEAALRQTCYRLAQNGNEVYKRLFLATDDDGKAKKIKNWLEHSRDRGDVESLELMLESDPGVPWDVVSTSHVRRMRFFRATTRWSRDKPGTEPIR